MYITLNSMESASNIYVHSLCNICISTDKDTTWHNFMLNKYLLNGWKTLPLRGLCKSQWCVHWGLQTSRQQDGISHARDLFTKRARESGRAFRLPLLWKGVVRRKNARVHTVPKGVWPGHGIVLEPQVHFGWVSGVTGVGLPGSPRRAQSRTLMQRSST